MHQHLDSLMERVSIFIKDTLTALVNSNLLMLEGQSFLASFLNIWYQFNFSMAVCSWKMCRTLFGEGSQCSWLCLTIGKNDVFWKRNQEEGSQIKSCGVTYCNSILYWTWNVTKWFCHEFFLCQYTLQYIGCLLVDCDCIFTIPF